jgi:hypothetical protein
MWPKYAVEIPKNTAFMSTRIVELLDWLNLSDRFLKEGKATIPIDKTIDYSPVKIKLNTIRDESLQYLHNILKGKEQ